MELADHQLTPPNSYRVSNELDSSAKTDTPYMHSGHKAPRQPLKRITGKHFKCTEKGCDKSFLTQLKFTQHLQLHTVERPLIKRHNTRFNADVDEKALEYIKSFRTETDKQDNEQFVSSSLPSELCLQSSSNASDNRGTTRNIAGKGKVSSLPHLGLKHFKCVEVGCGKVFIKRSNFTAHMRTHTGEEPFSCSWINCGKSFRHLGNLTTHIKSHIKGEKQCHWDGCNQIFFTESELFQHIRSKYDERQTYKCAEDGCNKVFKRRAHLVAHMRIHNDDKPYSCSWAGCGKSFRQLNHLINHTKSHTGEKPFKCRFEWCGKTFSQQGGLKSHNTRFHADAAEKPLEYIKCTSFGTEADKQDNEQIASSSSPSELHVQFSSKVVKSRGTISKTPRKVSALSPHGLKRFKCAEAGCGKVFVKRDHFTAHMRTHTGETPFSCSWENCGKSFKQLGHLTAHTKIHTGEKPFKCSWVGCGASFSQKMSLIRHTMTHTNEKPFKCFWKGCQKKFSREYDLNNHQSRIHTKNDENPFKCFWTGCGQAFSNQAHLTAHRKKSHSTDSHEWVYDVSLW